MKADEFLEDELLRAMHWTPAQLDAARRRGLTSETRRETRGSRPPRIYEVFLRTTVAAFVDDVRLLGIR